MNSLWVVSFDFFPEEKQQMSIHENCTSTYTTEQSLFTNRSAHEELLLDDDLFHWRLM